MTIEPTTDAIALRSGVTLAIRRFSPPEPSLDDDRSELPMVLTHGLASNARLWDGAAMILAERGHVVVTVDQRGHGASSKPDEGYDVPTVAEDLGQLIDEIGLDRPVVAGQSWGGNVVLELAASTPERVGGLALVDGGFLRLRTRFATWEECRDALAPPRLAGTPERQIRAWLDEMAADWPPEGREATMHNFERRPDGTVAPWLTFDRHLEVLRGLWYHDPATRYGVVEAPTTIIAVGPSGERPPNADWVGAAEAGLADHETVWFRPAHHDVHAQKPAEVADVLSVLADRVSSRG